jgi:hypothetical protein
MRLRRLLATLLLVASGAFGQTPLRTFHNRNDTFHVDLPATWRQIAPNEALQVGTRPDAPRGLTLAQPRHFYAVGPVDGWLAGDFNGPWLYVVEQDSEWFVEDDFATKLTTMWTERGKVSGERHELSQVNRAKVGKQQVEVILATRLSTPADGKPAMQCLDIYAPAGGSQLTLSFCCPPAQFASLEPEFRRWLATLTFARIRKGQASLGDRLWTPLIGGAVVAVVLLLLYKHTRGRR